MESILSASNMLARAPFQQTNTTELMSSICAALNSDSMALLSLDITQSGQISAIPHHAHHQIKGSTHSTYVDQFFRHDPVLNGAVRHLRSKGWAVFRLGDHGAKV